LARSSLLSVTNASRLRIVVYASAACAISRAEKAVTIAAAKFRNIGGICPISLRALAAASPVSFNP
jgi:hypothetical protein